MEAMRSIQVLNAITEIGLVVVVHHTGKPRQSITKKDQVLMS